MKSIIIPRHEILPDGGYRLLEPFIYYSKRYRKCKTCSEGMISDGASFIAADVDSISWWVHDALCDSGTWDDGTSCSRMEAANVIHDILFEEGRKIRAHSWWLFTGPLAVCLFGNTLPSSRMKG